MAIISTTILLHITTTALFQKSTQAAHVISKQGKEEKHRESNIIIKKGFGLKSWRKVLTQQSRR